MLAVSLRHIHRYFPVGFRSFRSQWLMHKWNPRLISKLSLFFVFVMLGLSFLACSPTPTREDFKGTAVSGDRQAQDFTLIDQFGSSKSLKQDFAGKVVVLTFLYTECPDVCPIVANHLRDVAELTEEEGSDAAIVIVSVDPAGDTVDSVLAYSERWQMADRWTYLVGEEAELKEVWKAYYIDPYVHGPGRADTEGVPEVRGAGSGGVSALVGQTGRVIHSAPIYIIDDTGIMRSVFTLPLESEDVAHDIRLVGN